VEDLSPGGFTPKFQQAGRDLIRRALIWLADLAAFEYDTDLFRTAGERDRLRRAQKEAFLRWCDAYEGSIGFHPLEMYHYAVHRDGTITKHPPRSG
jgi:hypothetical protein